MHKIHKHIIYPWIKCRSLCRFLSFCTVWRLKCVFHVRVLIGPCWQRHLHQIRLLCRRRVQMPRLLLHRWTSQRAAVCAVRDPQPTDGVSQRARRLTSIPIKARPHPYADILRRARFSGRESCRFCLWCVCFDEAGMRPRCQPPPIFYHCGRL